MRIQTMLTKKTILPILLAFLFIISSIMVWITYYLPSDQEETYFTQANTIIYQEGKQKEQGLYQDGQAYLPLSFLTSHIDETIRYDESSSSVIITTDTHVYQLPIHRNEVQQNGEPVTLKYDAATERQGEQYIAASLLERVYPIAVQYTKETEAVQVLSDEQKLQYGAVKKSDGVRLRAKPSVASPYVKEMNESHQVVIEKEKRGFYYVRANDGTAGYVKKGTIAKGNTSIVQAAPEQQASSFSPEVAFPVHVTWDSVNPSLSNKEQLPALPGVEVLSPKWFTLQTGKGSIESNASKGYVRAAHEKGYNVWALFSNAFDAPLTKQALSTYENRKTIIEQLLTFANTYQLDGINVDFENVFEEDGELFTQFIRELTPRAHEQGLVISVDVTFISSSGQWSKFYNRKALAESADFIMVMAYDEHWKGSSEPGSVSSLPWVRSNLERVLEEVPNEQLILGIPLYTRLWKTETDDQGTASTSSKALTMEEAKAWMEERNITPTYDEQAEQEYMEYEVSDQNITYRMWLENETSLQKRAQIVHTYDLAGVASWSMHFANEPSWEVLKSSLSKEE